MVNQLSLIVTFLWQRVANFKAMYCNFWQLIANQSPFYNDSWHFTANQLQLLSCLRQDSGPFWQFNDNSWPSVAIVGQSAINGRF